MRATQKSLNAGMIKSLAGLAMSWILLIVSSASAQQPAITNVAGVRALNVSEAAKARPVRLRGVVIDRSDPWDRAIIVADDTGGVYARAKTALFSAAKRGDLLELTGVTDPGEFAPIVSVTSVKKLGTAALPEPLSTSYHEITTGVMDAQWVEITGIVQRHGAEPGNTNILRTVVLVDGNPVHVRSVGPQNSNLTEDAEVRVQALCFYQVNQKRQLLSPILAVPRGVAIIVEKPAPADPFAAPVRSASSLLQFSPEVNSGHRVHVRGVVTHSQGDTTVWIRDGDAGLCLQTQSPESVQPGDLVDVLGFPKFGGVTPNLKGSVLQKHGWTNAPAPLALVSPTNAFDHENNLVSIEATLADVALLLESVTLTLKAEGTVFKAVLELPAPQIHELNWKSGSRVRVAGICSVNYEDTRPVMGLRHPQSFRMLLRSPGDLTIIEKPPWWTFEHVAYLFAAATVVLFIAVGVVTSLARRRLREQEQHRAMAEAEFAAILSERNRMAREIHDTLAQGLTATSFQLRLAKKHAAKEEDVLNHHLDAAQELVRGSLTEARSTIWNMRSQVLETHGLPGALENILNQMADSSECKTEFTVTGQVRRLAPVIENNLLRVGQEAITNAIRHAQAKRIVVQLDFTGKQFRLSVRDDGRGFDITHPPGSDGGFGLVGMKERAKEMNCAIEVRSVPGEGTEIVLTVPLPG